LYLIVIAGGIFSEVFVRQRMLIRGDALATAQYILEHETLFRSGFAITLFYLLCNIPLLFIFHEIFKNTHKPLVKMMVFFFLTGNTIEIVNMLNHFLPLNYLKTGAALEGLGEAGAASMAYMSLINFNTGFGISLVFFGCYCILIGFLIYKSRYLPHLIGILMGLGGICYIMNSFTIFLIPDFAKHLFPYILLPCFIAELSFASWLVFKRISLPPSANELKK